MPDNTNSEPSDLPRLEPGATWKDPLPDLDPDGVRPDGSCRIRREAVSGQDTEKLLNDMIGECGFLMREVAFRSMLQCNGVDDRLGFLRSAMNLASTGAEVAKTVAQLRAVPILADSLIADLQPARATKKKAKSSKQ